MEGLINWVPVFGAGGLLLALIFYFLVAAKPAGTELMRDIASMIHEGAMSYLKRQYKVLFILLVAASVSMYFYL